MNNDIFRITVDQRLANLHTANWTAHLVLRNDHKPNPSWLIVIHSPWNSTTGCSSTRLDWESSHIPATHWRMLFQAVESFLRLVQDVQPSPRPQTKPFGTSGHYCFLHVLLTRWLRRIVVKHSDFSTIPQYTSFRHFTLLTSFPGPYTVLKRTWERGWRLRSQLCHSDVVVWPMWSDDTEDDLKKKLN